MLLPIFWLLPSGLQLILCKSGSKWLYLPGSILASDQFRFINLRMSEPSQDQQQGCFHWLCFKTWYPFSTLKSVLFVSVLIGCLFVCLALVQFAAYSKSYSRQVTYSLNGKCQGVGTGSSCQLELDIPQDLSPPLLFLYTLSGSYVNHRKYIGSSSEPQLQGKAIDLATAQKTCSPFVTNKDFNAKVSFQGTPLLPDSIAHPCGFEAFLYFNDTFALYSQSGAKVVIDESNLHPDHSNVFSSRQGSEKEQWINVMDEHFQEWTKEQALIRKYKLWGRINQPLAKGKYNLVVANNYHINTLKIGKGIQLVHPTSMGGPVYFFPITFLIMGLTCIAYAAFLKIRLPDYDQLVTPQKHQ